MFAYTQFWDVQSKLRKELRSDLLLAQGVVWGSHFAPALARLFFDLQKESGDDADDSTQQDDDDEARIDRLAGRITRKDFFDRVERAYNLGQEASRLETSYQRLGDDGTRAFIALFLFAVFLPVSALFGLLPGAEEQDTTWVVAVTSWSALVALVFGLAAFFSGQFWRHKSSLIRMLDEYQA
ncbi:MAG: hypothetical protein IID30_03255 [Planctomycetes bacterium]|nr:hypothetical protein [Planctomycetota bacterium]